jgi:hypothetical protein
MGKDAFDLYVCARKTFKINPPENTNTVFINTLETT